MSAATPQRSDPLSDHQGPGGNESAPKKASRQVLRHEIEEGLDTLERPVTGLFVSGLSAGLVVGFSLFLMAVLLPHPVVQILVANLYAAGFLFVVLGRSELFTDHRVTNRQGGTPCPP
jgi:formate-nitrite transporter family protein